MKNPLNHLAIATTIAASPLALADTFTHFDFNAIADSVADFSDTQGANGWNYGYYNDTTAPGVFTMDNFAWNGSWDYETAPGTFNNPPWTNIDANGGHPNGDNNGDVHHAVRRYTVPGTIAPGSTLDISWFVRKANVGGGNGTTGQLFHTPNGGGRSLVDSATVAFNDGSGYTATKQITVSPGDIIDVALTPEGSDGTFGDASDGSAFGMSLGVDNSVTYNNVPKIADSRADWSTTGTQGENGWFYGYYNQTDDTDNSDGVYQTDDFIEFANTGGQVEVNGNHWQGNFWDLANGGSTPENVPWTMLNQEAAHPNGDNNGAIHHAIRRYEVQPGEAGQLGIEWDLSAQNTNGTGTSVIVSLNGVELDSATIAGNDAAGITRTLITSANEGDLIEFALTSLGTDGTFADGADGSIFGASIYLIPEPGALALISLSGLALIFRRRR